MAIQKVNLGVPVTGEGGDTYRQAHTKINDNFTDVTNSFSKTDLKIDDAILEANTYADLKANQIGNKLSNEVYNAKLDPSKDHAIYNYNTASSDNAPIVAVVNTELQKLGIEHAQKITKDKRGAFAEVQIFDRKIIGNVDIILATLVYDPSGAFNFGADNSGGVSAYIRKANIDGTNATGFLGIGSSEFRYTELSSKVRLYQCVKKGITLNQTTYPNTYLSSIIVGARLGLDAVDSTMYVTGRWVSITANAERYTAPLSMASTYYPNFDNISEATLDYQLNKQGKNLDLVKTDITELYQKSIDNRADSKTYTDAKVLAVDNKVTNLDSKINNKGNKLYNEVYNSTLNPNKYNYDVYSYTLNSSDNAPIEYIEQEDFKKLGIEYAQKITKDKRGAFAEVQLGDRNLTGTYTFFLSMLVHDTTGNFIFGGFGANAYFRRSNKDGTGTPTNTITFSASRFSYTEISPTTRLYYLVADNITLNQTTYPNTYLSSVIFGTRLDVGSLETMFVTGRWASYTDNKDLTIKPFSIDSTYYPNFDYISNARLAELIKAKELESKTISNKNKDDIVVIKDDVLNLKNGSSTTVSNTDKNANLKQLYSDLHNPLLNVKVKIVGDSISWGVGASGTTAGSASGTLLTAIRNTTDASISPSWVNLLSRYLMTTFSSGTINHEGDGIASAQSNSEASFSRHTGIFKFKDVNNKVYTKDEIRAAIVVDTINFSNEEYIDLGSKNSGIYSEFSFNVRANSFNIHYTTLPNGDNNSYFINVYVDDIFKQKISLYSASAIGNKFITISLPDGKNHKITIKNESTVSKSARLQYISINKVISVANDAISGSTSHSWITAVTIDKSIKADDDYIFMQIGTNDRITNIRNSKALLSRNIRSMIETINTNTEGKGKVILMCANEVTQDELREGSAYFMRMQDVNKIIKAEATFLNLPFISHYENTVQYKLDNILYLADKLHPNDLGYKLAFDLIKDSIIKGGSIYA